MSCLGIVTIGQSPRVDMVPELRRWLGQVEVIERGALDGLTPAEVARLRPDAEPGGMLVSRMRDGSSVQLAARHIYPLVCEAVRSAETSGADVTLVVCTGEMPPIPHQRALLHAEGLIAAGAGALSAGGRLGVVCPDPGQAAATGDRWARVTEDPLVAPASPYAEDSLDRVTAAARRLAADGAEVLVLDCMGYPLSARRAAAAASGLPVLLAREVVARLAAARLDTIPPGK